jgi:Xaa-Pro aminopeptidase
MEFDYPERHGFGLGVPSAVFRERQARLRAFLRGRELEAAVVSGSSSRYAAVAWLANHVPAAGETAVLRVAADGPTSLYADACREDLVVVDGVRPRADSPDPAETPGLAGWLSAQRAVKEDSEIDLLDEAATVASLGVEAAVSMTLPEATERHVAAAAVSAALRAGADGCRCLVRSGALAAEEARWPDAGDRVLQPGEPVLIDLRGACQGYRFRLVHTAAVGGAAPRHADAHAGAAAALSGMVDALRPGAPPRALWDRGRAAGVAPEGADLGHGIGLDGVEEPRLWVDGDAPLPAGAVLLLTARVGPVRLGRMVAVQTNGARRLGRLFAPAS